MGTRDPPAATGGLVGALLDVVMDEPGDPNGRGETGTRAGGAGGARGGEVHDEIDRVRDDEDEALLTVLVAEQNDPSHAIAYLGDDREGIRAELGALRHAADTLRVGRDADGSIVALAFADWDEELGRAWIHGPWARDEAAWDRYALPLFEAVLRAIPAGVTGHEIAATLANIRLAAFARSLGWTPTEVNHALVLDGAALGALVNPAANVRAARGTSANQVADGGTDGAAAAPSLGDSQECEVGGVSWRSARAEDLPLLDPLHVATFPATYFSAAQLVAQAAHGEAVVLVAEREGAAIGAESPVGPVPLASTFLGYAAGRIHTDGSGYIDFLAVEPDSLRRGVGRVLLRALVAELVARGASEVALTVRDSLGPARSLYAALGFRTTASLVGYRSPGWAGL